MTRSGRFKAVSFLHFPFSASYICFLFFNGFAYQTLFIGIPLTLYPLIKSLRREEVTGIEILEKFTFSFGLIKDE